MIFYILNKPFKMCLEMEEDQIITHLQNEILHFHYFFSANMSWLPTNQLIDITSHCSASVLYCVRTFFDILLQHCS